MITIRIGQATRSLSDADANWLTQQVQMRRHDALDVCVEIRVKEPDIDMILRTSSCAPGGSGGGRAPNPKEQSIFTLWDRTRMNTPDFTGGNLVAFVRQLQHVL